MEMERKLIIGFLISLFVVACKEETRVNEVVGTVYSECGVPLGGAEIALKANSGGSFNESIILATDITESNGYFRFTYELEEDKSGTGDLILVENPGYTTLLTNIALNKDQELYPYKNELSPVVFTYTGQSNLQNTDTLFYSLQYGGNDFVIGPTIGFKDTLYSKLPNTIDAKRWVAFSYGVGQVEYRKSIQALGIKDSSYNQVYVQVEGCGDLDQFNLWIQ